MSQTGPFCPWQGPLEWFNQILLFTVHHHHPGEASCQNRKKVTAQILNKFVCWSLTSLCHSNGHIETMPAREINPFTALTRIRSQFLRTQWSTSNHSEWTRIRLRPLSHRAGLNKWTISVKIGESGKFRPFRPWKMTFRAIQSNPALGSWLVPSSGRFMPK